MPCHAGFVDVRCLIVDDSPRFLTASSSLLASQGLTVVGVASSAAQALQLVAELQPDVTLVDIDLGGESGLDVARRLSAVPAPPPIILISTHDEQDFAGLIAASPAIGFVSKMDLSAVAIRSLLGDVAGQHA